MGRKYLTQIYMAWLQLLHYENWHSLIVTDVENSAPIRACTRGC